MKIKLLTSVAGTDYAYASDSVVDAPEEIARDLIRGGHAIPAETSMKIPIEDVETAVPKQKREKR